MHSKYKIILLLFALAVFSACESLEEKPFTFIGVDNIYQNEDDVDKALLGIYNTLFFAGTNDLWYFLTLSGPSENVTVRLKPQGQGRMSSVNFDETTPHGSFWGAFYQGINRANTVIENIPQAGLDTGLASAKEAEARFMRAFYYFHLVRMFGGVPLQLESTKDFSDEAVKKPRASIEEVYAVILDDLNYAVANLPTSRPPSAFGRAEASTANTLLGKVYLQMAGLPLQQTARYADAITTLEKVIGEYALEDNFSDVFTIANEQNEELIFVRPNLTNIDGSGTVLTFFAGAPNTPFAFNGGQYQFAFTEVLYNLFDSTDLRLPATFLYTYTNANGQEVTYNSPTNPAGLQFGGPRRPNGIPMGKLRDSNNTLSPFGHGNDLILLRYADVLLMLAEAHNEAGNAAAALPYLNQIRNRAGLADVTETNQAALRDIIKTERKKELAGEFTEYFDLQRWGDLEASMAINPDAIQLNVSYSPKLELLPIPRGVLETNENLVQNPGY
ncbi:RagB/SusD family nutrient uptake outer membrane protein [Neolewinella lacunae]|uniref:RagB/SusD family nutrient uptake outer membrane protein n=1 Tax=Neolewinella lacunae TaxID=1517758 RepID=A0A923PRU7_9BACT|nr:RagB/SusD family nutrient uptake outer membrane protein [Neolewinella lacunae]MBC6996601.1 RagB/SusD family nutrient uptake outer membrane protein [Neolewinella lacunae]MDN3634835.1 RagB/SusD family nutrient uptake outer membrane protein [Neolewinella lacunae]